MRTKTAQAFSGIPLDFPCFNYYLWFYKTTIRLWTLGISSTTKITNLVAANGKLLLGNYSPLGLYFNGFYFEKKEKLQAFLLVFGPFSLVGAFFNSTYAHFSEEILSYLQAIP